MQEKNMYTLAIQTVFYYNYVDNESQFYDTIAKTLIKERLQ